jgi:CheY-like chemotaxis protein
MLVLVVDDEESLCELLAEILAGDYEVIKAFNGKTAYELARQAKPDLIVSDVMMPQMSGVELLKAIRNDPDTAHIPVILLSAVPLKAKVAEASAFLAKPFEIEVLEKVVAKVAHEEAQGKDVVPSGLPPDKPGLSRPASIQLGQAAQNPASKIYWKNSHF